MTVNKEENNLFVNFFSSTQLTIVVLILLALGSILGTVIIQKGTEESVYITQKYSPTTIKIFEKLGFFDMYHSPIYVGLLGVLILNLIVCSYVRLKKDLKKQSDRKDNFFPSDWKKLKYSAMQKFKQKGDIIQNIESVLAEEGYSFTKLKENKWIGKKNTWCKYGFYVAHVGILIILLGGLISSLFSIEGFLWMVPGDTTSMFVSNIGEKINLGFNLKCNDFSIKQYPNGMVKEYETKLIIEKKSGEKYPFSLVVNRPLSENGFRLYQASYQQVGIKGVKLLLQWGNNYKRELTMKIPDEKNLEIPGSQKVVLKTLRFEPDFVIGPDGKITSRSDEMNNPALQYQMIIDDIPEQKHWTFANFDHPHNVGQDQYQVHLIGLETGFATGIQVVHDPGSLWIWVGSIVLIGGLIISFFVFQEIIWIKWVPSSSGGTVYVGGSISRSWTDFQHKVDSLVFKIMKKQGISNEE